MQRSTSTNPSAVPGTSGREARWLASHSTAPPTHPLPTTTTLEQSPTVGGGPVGPPLHAPHPPWGTALPASPENMPMPGSRKETHQRQAATSGLRVAGGLGGGKSWLAAGCGQGGKWRWGRGWK